MLLMALTRVARTRTSLGSCNRHQPSRFAARSPKRYFSKRGHSSPCFALTKVNSRMKSCEVGPFKRGTSHPQLYTLAKKFPLKRALKPTLHHPWKEVRGVPGAQLETCRVNAAEPGTLHRGDRPKVHVSGFGVFKVFSF